MKRLAAARNRGGLTVLGLFLLLGGAAVLTIGLGLAERVAPWASPDGTLEPIAGLFSRQGSAAMALLAAAIVLALGLRWIVSQFPRKDSATPFRMHRDVRTGITSVASEVIAEAVSDDLELTSGVRGSQVIVRGTTRHPELFIGVDVDERADIRSVVADIADRVSGNCSLTLGQPLAAVGVEIGIASTPGRKQRSIRIEPQETGSGPRRPS